MRGRLDQTPALLAPESKPSHSTLGAAAPAGPGLPGSCRHSADRATGPSSSPLWSTLNGFWKSGVFLADPQLLGHLRIRKASHRLPSPAHLAHPQAIPSRLGRMWAR